MFNRNNRNNRNRKKIMALILAASMVLSNVNIPVVSTALDSDSVVYASDISSPGDAVNEEPEIQSETVNEEPEIQSEAAHEEPEIQSVAVQEEQEVQSETVHEKSEIAAEDLISMPAQDFEERTASGIIVRAFAGSDIFPENTTMIVKDVSKEITDQLTEKIDNEVQDAIAVDISFRNELGEEIEPKDGKNIDVSIEIPEKKKLEGESFELLHYDDQNDVMEKVEDIVADSTGVEFSNGEFSIYVFTANGYVEKDQLTGVIGGDIQKTPNSHDNPYIMRVGQTIKLRSDSEINQYFYVGEAGGALEIISQEEVDTENGRVREAVIKAVAPIGNTRIWQGSSTYYISVIDPQSVSGQNYDHSDIEISDGVVYTTKEATVYKDGTVKMVERTYEMYVANIDYSELYGIPYGDSEEKMLAKYENHMYQPLNVGQNEFTSKYYSMVYQNQYGQWVHHPDVQFVDKSADITKAIFHIDIGLKPISEKTTVTKFEGTPVVTENPNFQYTDDSILENQTMVCTQQMVIDANNVCPDHSGFDFSINDSILDDLVVSPQKLQLKVQKNLKGKNIGEGDFEFELYDENGVIDTASCNSSGVAVFDEIYYMDSSNENKVKNEGFIYSGPGEYHYFIREILPKDGENTVTKKDGMEYDDHICEVTVKVTRRVEEIQNGENIEKNYVLDINTVYSDGENGAVFNNTYTPVKRNVEGVAWLDTDKDSKIDDEEEVLGGKTVQLIDENGNVIAETTTKADGSYKFEDVAAGTYDIVVKVDLDTTEKKEDNKADDGSDTNGTRYGKISSIVLPSDSEIRELAETDSQNEHLKITNDEIVYTLYDQNAGFIEDPTPVTPTKKEAAPYDGTGVLGEVKVGQEITYEINYKNYKNRSADIVIKDQLDPNVEFVSASNGGVNTDGTVNWTLKSVPAGEEGTVTLKVKVLESALSSKQGPGKVVNGGDTATVKVGNDNEYVLNAVENPVDEYDVEKPHKEEVTPYQGTGVLSPVKVGDEITYKISYKNYKTIPATVVIKDTLDENVEFVEASNGGTEDSGVVTWTIANVAAGKSGEVTLKVKVLEGALSSKRGPGKVVNGGDSTTVKVGNDTEQTVEAVENPVPDNPTKNETAPYQGQGKLGSVKVGDEITYEISYKNYKSTAADVVIKDTLDKNVEFVSASDEGTLASGIVTWTLKSVPAGEEGTVTLKVKVLESALSSKQGPGKVVNGGDTSSVKVGNDNEYTLNTVENPVDEYDVEKPHKEEVTPYQGTGELSPVKVGDEITYKISYKNYKTIPATIVINDTLDENVEFVEASNGGTEDSGVVTWTIRNVAAGQSGEVTLKVKVLEGALSSKRGPGKVVNGGDSTTVKVGNDTEQTVETVENPVPDNPTKKETAPYQGQGKLGSVKVGDEITYEISYKNYKSTAADVVIKDTLDKNVEFVSASDEGTLASGIVTWTLKSVPAGEDGTVTLKVKVLEGALKSKGGTGSVINGGDTASVKVGNDNEYTLNTVENPVDEYDVEKPHKEEVTPYQGTGELSPVKVGDEITYKISYKNYKTIPATVVIKDILDENVEFVEASDGGANTNGTVTWTIANVAAGATGEVTLKVKVLEGALSSKRGPGKVVNGGDSTTVKVGNDTEQTVETVENPVPDNPTKKETAPYQGQGKLGSVKVGDEITYEISYKNYKSTAADVVIKDTLDKNVEFVEASNGGVNTNGVVTWTLKSVPAGEEGTVTLKVKVLEGALKSQGGTGSVVNGGDTATVKVGNDNEYTLNTVENPVDEYDVEKPHKEEVTPYQGTGELSPVKVGDEITYKISYKNYKTIPATVVIKDILDENVEFVEASDGGANTNGTVTWTIRNVAAGATGEVTLKVKVLEGALSSKRGPGKVVNGGDSTTVKVGNDTEQTVEAVENPVPDNPTKKETSPYQGQGKLGSVKVGDEITYEISYKNYKSTAADVVIKDTLDKNVEFVSASDEGTLASGIVTWTLKSVPAGEEGTVTLKVKVLEGALKSKGGTGSVINGGDTATVKVGNDNEYTLNTVENPVDEYDVEKPHKEEVTPYQGTGELSPVKVGDEITYKISYKNYKTIPATIVINDTLDENVEFVEASNGGTEDSGVVTWTIRNVAAGQSGEVTLKVKVLEGALSSKRGPGKVVNGGDSTTVKVGNDTEQTVEAVENPVPDNPTKKETAPYQGQGKLGSVKVGDEITYEISYKNYKSTAADVVIKDTLDKNVEFVSASDEGTLASGIVTWTLKSVPAGEEGTVTLKVKVLEGALKSKGGTGSVINGGDTASVKVGNDNEYTLNTVENPVDEYDVEKPHKEEVTPYQGTGELSPVKVGDEITYKISYKNYKTIPATVVIKDILDENVEFVEASDGGANTNGTVTWTIRNVAAGATGEVTLKVKVLEGALSSKRGTGKVVNGGDSTTVKVGNDTEQTVEAVENPVPDNPTKKETAPYQGQGKLGSVKVGDEITYEISYKNYKSTAADVVIKDTLDKNVEFVSASDEGTLASGIVTWTLKSVPAGEEGTVTLKVKVLESALSSKQGPGKVVNGGDTATVKVGNDNEYTLNTAENPVDEYDVEKPHKEEVTPYQGTGELSPVKVGDEITYKISYKNYKTIPATVVIKDTLDENVEFVEASNGGVNTNGTVTWTIANVAAGATGEVTLKVKVLEGALSSKRGPGKVVNGGDSTTVKVGNDTEQTVEAVENPVPDNPTKKETAPYQGQGKLGSVKVGDEITYEISYKNYKGTAADVVIKDTLDENVEFVEASNGGVNTNGVVTWTLKSVPAGEEGTVTLIVKVLESALSSKQGPGKVVNGGDTATVKVGNDNEYTLNTVENPVDEYDVEKPHKEEVTPYQGTGILGDVKVGDEITYRISYKNYKTEKADVVISDKLDANVQYVKSSDGGSNNNGTVVWTIKDVPAGTTGEVTLSVKVLEGALASKGGNGKVVNGGDTSTVKVGNDPEYILEVVENPVIEEITPTPPVPVKPTKREVVPYVGNGTLGEVKVGDEIIYQIKYKNYTNDSATVTIKDKLDPQVSYITSSDNGVYENGTVIWTIKDVPAGQEGSVSLRVKVLEGALKSNGGTGKVVNGGDTATVQIGNEDIFTLDMVENPVVNAEKTNDTTTTTEKTSTVTITDSKVTSVKTGDNMSVGLIAALLILSTAGIVILAIRKRRKKF